MGGAGFSRHTCKFSTTEKLDPKIFEKIRILEFQYEWVLLNEAGCQNSYQKSIFWRDFRTGIKCLETYGTIDDRTFNHHLLKFKRLLIFNKIDNSNKFVPFSYVK